MSVDKRIVVKPFFRFSKR